jgi:WD40 repeat protein
MPPHHLAFRPGTAHLAVASGKVVRVFDLDGGNAALPDLSHPDDVSGIAWHPDGRTLATACDDYRIRLWDVAAGKLSLPPMVGHGQGGIIAAFNPAGDYLLSNDWSRSMRLWDARTGHLMLQAQCDASEFSREGDLVAPDRSGSRVRLLRMATHRPLRTLAAPGDSGERRVHDARVSPDGRLLFVTRSDALAVVDWTSGAELASIPLPVTWVVRFDLKQGLLTSGRNEGLFRWPVRAEPEAGRLHIGPPEGLRDRPNPHIPGCSADGHVVAIPAVKKGDKRGALVLHLLENGSVWLGPREDVRRAAVSPNGRLVATGNHNNLQGIGTTVWDARSGEMIRDLPVGGLCEVGFSPDNRWLLTTGGRLRLWKTGTWKEGPPLAQPDVNGQEFAFTPDSRTLAIVGGFSQVWLVDVDNGAEIARLTVPEHTRVLPRCFSPDGAELVAVGAESNLLYIWDLRALRAQLKELGLEWCRDYPEAVQAAPAPREIRIVGADDLLTPQGLKREAWRLVTGRADRRDPARALQLIQKAVKREPANATLWNTLGVAQYRNGQHKEAVASLETSLAAGNPSPAFDLFFLAMCHAKLGNAARAKERFEEAVKAMEAQTNLDARDLEQLNAFRSEAAEAALRAP